MITINAIGDVSFEGRNRDNPDPGIFNGIASQLEAADLCIANLECPLTSSQSKTPDKCVLRGHPDWAPIMRRAGITLVSLANNHIMDYGARGLADTRQCLDAAGVSYIGAGNTLQSAGAPVFIEIRNARLAFLARSAVPVSSPSNAGPDRPGVAFFQPEETMEAIRRCRRHADFVLLLLHWGLEGYAYPSPEQRRTARKLIKAGADVILGHHPHVLQGVESISGGLVAYSLGNFAFDDIVWSRPRRDGSVQQMRVALSEDNRTGAVLTMVLKNRTVENTRCRLTRIDRESGYVSVQAEPGDQVFKRLSRMFGLPFYPLAWRLYSLRQEFLLRLAPRISGKLRPAKLRKLRPRHVLELARLLSRSKRIVTGKSTNPYE